jgi:hypothetical protein
MSNVSAAAVAFLIGFKPHTFLTYLAIKDVGKKVLLRGGSCSCTVFYHHLYGIKGFLWNDCLVGIFDNHNIFSA